MPPLPHTLAGHDPATGALRAELASAMREVATLRAELATRGRLLMAAERLGRTLDRDELVSLVLDCAMELAGADTGSVMLLDRFEQSLWIARSIGLADDIVRSSVVSLGEGISGWVAQTGKGQVVNDIPAAPRRTGRIVRSAVCVPMTGQDGRCWGVVNVGTTSETITYSDADLARLTTLSDLASLAFANAEELEESKRLFLEALRALVVAIETKDPFARGHTEHVTRFAVLLARAIGMPEEQVQTIELASMLHDIGRLSTGEAMAVQGRDLSALEQTLIKLHPQAAAQVLKNAPSLAEVVPVVFYHHERFDGGGLTGALGDQIPLGARILAIADAYEAMTSDRPHRPSRTPADALAEIERNAGTQFDPELVGVFAGLVEDDPRAFKSGV